MLLFDGKDCWFDWLFQVHSNFVKHAAQILGAIVHCWHDQNVNMLLLLLYLLCAITLAVSCLILKLVSLILKVVCGIGCYKTNKFNSKWWKFQGKAFPLRSLLQQLLYWPNKLSHSPLLRLLWARNFFLQIKTTPKSFYLLLNNISFFQKSVSLLPSCEKIVRVLRRVGSLEIVQWQ